VSEHVSARTRRNPLLNLMEVKSKSVVRGEV
jgi:hypothetical protein